MNRDWTDGRLRSGKILGHFGRYSGPRGFLEISSRNFLEISRNFLDMSRNFLARVSFPGRPGRQGPQVPGVPRDGGSGGKPDDLHAVEKWTRDRVLVPQFRLINHTVRTLNR